MYKMFVILLLLTLSVFARHEAFPTKVCPAFNNMKHSTNTHDVYLDTRKKYTIMKEHKEQKLILISGEQPAQRWVDADCFSSLDNIGTSVDSAIERIDKSTVFTKHTKKYEESGYTKPVSKNNGFASDLHKHEWVKHGTCYGSDPQAYFEDAVSLVEQLNNSKVGDFFTKNIGKHVTLQQVRHLFDRNFGVGTGKRVEMKCKKGLITELWLHLGANSDDLGTLLQRGKQVRSRCQKGLIDRAGYGR